MPARLTLRFLQGNRSVDDKKSEFPSHRSQFTSLERFPILSTVCSQLESAYQSHRHRQLYTHWSLRSSGTFGDPSTQLPRLIPQCSVTPDPAITRRDTSLSIWIVCLGSTVPTRTDGVTRSSSRAYYRKTEAEASSQLVKSRHIQLVLPSPSHQQKKRNQIFACAHAISEQNENKKMASTIPQNRSQSSINTILAPTPMASSSASFSHQDISRALEASASMLPKYYTSYANRKTASSASSPAAMEHVGLSGDYYPDHHYVHQPPPPPPSPVGFPSSSSMHDWSAVERKRG